MPLHIAARSLFLSQPPRACSVFKVTAAYSLFGPVVRNVPVQGDAVAQLGVVAVLLVPPFTLSAVLPQRGSCAALS